MSRRRRAKREPAAGSGPEQAHVHPWDVPEPADRKTLQLCGQVKDALYSALAACGDPVLQAAAVERVEPAPNAGRLRVLVTLPADGLPTRAEAETHLRRAAGMLRAEVAAAVARRHAPELVFEVIG